MCYILCMVRTSVYVVSGVQGGGAPPFPRGSQGGESPLAWGFRGSALEMFFLGGFLRPFLGGFSTHGFSSLVFYFQ
jgi:hypothetical protein